MPNKKSLYREIYDYVYGLVSSGEHPPDGRLPTESQLCERFGTSRATVAKAMKELEHSGIIRRQAGAGSFAVMAGPTKGAFAALLIAGLGDTEFFSPICAQIAQTCQKYNISLIWGSAGPATEITRRSDIDQICRRLIEQQVTGVFFAPNQLSWNNEIEKDNTDLYLAETLTRSGIAVVLIDRDLSLYPSRSAFDYVGIDNINAAYEQTRHLYRQGCRRVIHITRPGLVTTKAARTAGFNVAVEQLDLKFTETNIFSGDADDHQFVLETLDCKPDGVVCFNDPVATSYLHSLLALGVQVPETIKVIGLDDLEYSRLLPVPLSTMRQPRREIGELAVEVLVRRLNNPALPSSETLLTTKLIPRESTMRSEELKRHRSPTKK